MISREGNNSPRDLVGWMFGTKRTIRVDELAAVLIDTAINGSKEETLQNNLGMVTRGRELRQRTLGAANQNSIL